MTPLLSWLRRAALVPLACVALSLIGCATTTPGGVPIDTRYTAQGQDSRAQFLILHYTDEPLSESIEILTRQQVSSHYLLSDENPPVIYRLVDENRRAWHAGDSHWAGSALLNAASIGIEIVNPGLVKLPEGGTDFGPYPPQQIDTLVRLVKDIVARHQILPTRILGHSDIAPQRKIDPGAKFPWKRLADEGLIPWPDAGRMAAQQKIFEATPPDLAWVRMALAKHGYKVPEGTTLDEPLRRVLRAFQLRFRPERWDGQPDAQTAALLHVLITPVADAAKP